MRVISAVAELTVLVQWQVRVISAEWTSPNCEIMRVWWSSGPTARAGGGAAVSIHRGIGSERREYIWWPGLFLTALSSGCINKTINHFFLWNFKVLSLSGGEKNDQTRRINPTCNWCQRTHRLEFFSWNLVTCSAHFYMDSFHLRPDDWLTHWSFF